MPFSPLCLHPTLLRGIQALGYTRPTPIQTKAIPPAMEGRDILASAMTGSGKTAAFVLPILHRLTERPRSATRALILTPTRELAAQIEENVALLGRHARVSVAAVIGGVGMRPQEQAFRRGVSVMVATPGRLLDHMRSSYATLSGVEVLVLDEADRMLDMGFLPDVRRILSRLPARRQTLFFSATMPPPIVSLSREMLRDPVAIAVDPPAAPPSAITHAAYPVSAELKSALLVELVRRGEIRSVIAFTRTKHRANRLADYLARNGVAAGRIHGNRSQTQRTQALSGFKAGKFPVLVATDIAARGIDVDALSHVVNFDVPKSPEDYVHRVGRTARAEAKGDAFVFVSPEEEANVRGIERAIGKKMMRVMLPGFDYMRRPAEKLEAPLGQRLAKMRSRRAAATIEGRRDTLRPRGRRVYAF
ncbi:MAG: DEAD/DEAH box helicase [Vicinamibacteria bacterium]|nr:DEAD/DEAH box helicase [Vicinamibacteria bacterium]